MNNKKACEFNELSNELKRELVAEKIIMNELLNAEEFNILLETTQREFKKTFGISNINSNIEEEKEID